MKIVMVIGRFSPCRGGIELLCERLAQRLNTRGHEITILTERYQPDLPTSEMMEGMKIIRIRTWGRPPFSSLQFLAQGLLFLLFNRSIDLFHGFLFSSTAVLSILAGRFTRRPVLVTMGGSRHTGDIEVSQRSMLGRWKLRFIHRRLPHACCPSEETAQELSALGVEEERIHIIPNGIDTLYFRPPTELERQSARHTLGQDPKRKTMLFVGRCVPGKGIERLLSIWRKGIDRAGFRWDLQLVIPGDKDVPEIHQAMNEMRSRIRLSRNVPDMRMYYHAADAAILLSEGEGLSLFLLEAMACGLPTITTDAAAIASTMERNEWSTTLPIDKDLDGRVLEQLVEWSNHDGMLITMASAARQKALGFDLDTVSNQYEKLYSELLRR